MSFKLLNTLAAATTLAGVVTMAGIANAASLVQTASTDLSQTNITDDPLTINQFDPSLGTLESVTVEFSANVESTPFLMNTGNAEVVTDVTIESEVGLTLDDQSLFNITLEEDSEFTVGVGETENEEQIIATETQTETFTDSELLQAFTGNGVLDLLFSASATFDSETQGGANLITGTTTQASSNIVVTYNYENFQDVPEPSSILGFGLIAGVGMVSLRKKNLLKMSKV